MYKYVCIANKTFLFVEKYNVQKISPGFVVKLLVSVMLVMNFLRGVM